MQAPVSYNNVHNSHGGFSYQVQYAPDTFIITGLIVSEISVALPSLVQ